MCMKKSVYWLIIFSAIIWSPLEAGTLHFDGVPVDITTTDGEDLVIVPGVGGNTQIGDLLGINSFATSNDDLHITGILEVDGIFYAEGGVGSHLFPSTGSSFDLGSLSKRWSNAYLDKIFIELSDALITDTALLSVTGTAVDT